MTYPIFRNKHLHEALIQPEDFISYRKFNRKDFPRKYIITYQSSADEYFRRKYSGKYKIIKLSSKLNICKMGDAGFINAREKSPAFKREFVLPISPGSPKAQNKPRLLRRGKRKGFVILSGIGSPFAVTVFEEFVSLGGREFINIGTAGGRQHEGVFLCDRAIRDEGMSYHYVKILVKTPPFKAELYLEHPKIPNKPRLLSRGKTQGFFDFPHGKYSYSDKDLTKKFERSLIKFGLAPEKATSWTIDAPYRETKKKIVYYKKLGVAVVEMEASALFAVAKYRKVKIASAFVVSDVLGEKLEPKLDHIDVKKTQNKMVDAAIDCLNGGKK